MRSGRGQGSGKRRSYQHAQMVRNSSVELNLIICLIGGKLKLIKKYEVKSTD